MSDMDYKKLSDFADFREERTANITFENYISTENMIKDKGGITRASSLPDVKTTSAYHPNDILLSNIRPYFRKIWLATQKGSCSNDVLVVKAKENILPRFLYYVLSDNNFFNYDTVTSKGTKMPRGTPKAIMKYLVPDVQPEKQERISDILSAYDELIENNNKRIKTLEQMAENLYKEWFVRFRFPGYENAEFEDGVPKGWKEMRLGDFANIEMGQSPESIYYNIEKKGLPFHQGVGSYGNLYLVDDIYSTAGKRIASPNSIIFSVRAPVGRININLNKIILGRGVASINAKNKCQGFLLWCLKRNFQKEDIIGNGSIFTSVTKNELFGYKLLIPQKELLNKYNDIACKIEQNIRTITLANQALTKQRDLLLPRLMSGKLEV